MYCLRTHIYMLTHMNHSTALSPYTDIYELNICIVHVYSIEDSALAFWLLCEREREKEERTESECVRARTCVCVCVCVCEREIVCVCVCVCV